MALRSQLFQGDPKLEAAANSDPAHITAGAVGDHVRKIQLALNQLDGADLDPDGKYGPATTAAVRAYKQKRSIINTSYQTEADGIVGKMTIAALDGELLADEVTPEGAILIKPVDPAPVRVGGASFLRLGFVIDVDHPVFPGGNFPTIRLAPRSRKDFDIVNGRSGSVACQNLGKSEGKICFIFDPDESSLIPPTRLIPGPQGPKGKSPLRDGGTVQIGKDSFLIRAEVLHPGNAVITASNASSASVVAIEVRAPKLAPVAGFTPPTKTRPGSKFISAADSEPGPKGARTDFGGRPVNPKGTGRKINLFGSQETPGFEDYTTDLHFSGFAPGKFEISTSADTIFRPWTNDNDAAVRIEKGKASDICSRDSPVSPETIEVIRTIASSRCRLTFTFSKEGGAEFIPVLKAAFPGSTILEEFPDAIVMELP